MSDNGLTVIVSDAEGTITAAMLAKTKKPRSGRRRVVKCPDFGEPSQRPVFGGTKWDDNDRSYEDMRRPPLRRNKLPEPEPSPSDEVEAMEGQLVDDEIARRKVLEGQYSPSEIEAKLDQEFGERRRELERALKALAN